MIRGKILPAAVMGIVAVVLGASGAFAQSSGTEGFYLRFESGFTSPAAPTGTSNGQLTTTNVETGYGGGGAAGYKFGAFRGEVALYYSKLNVTNLRANNVTYSTTGDQTNRAVMVNGYYDIATGTPFVPYIGMGIGFTRIGLNHIASQGTTFSNGSTNNLAYQPMVGIQYLINTQWSVGAEFRYFASTDAHYTSSLGLPATAGNATWDGLLSVSYHFGTPSAPAAPTR